MIVEEKFGNLLRAEEPIILFTVNKEGHLDAGLARQMLFQFPELVKEFPAGEEISRGVHLVFSASLEGKLIVALQCHSLRDAWYNEFACEMISKLDEFILNEVGDDADEAKLSEWIDRGVAIPKIGTGLVGVSLGADWEMMRKAFEDSPLKFTLYKR